MISQQVRCCQVSHLMTCASPCAPGFVQAPLETFESKGGPMAGRRLRRRNASQILQLIGVVTLELRRRFVVDGQRQ